MHVAEVAIPQKQILVAGVQCDFKTSQINIAAPALSAVLLLSSDGLGMNSYAQLLCISVSNVIHAARLQVTLVKQNDVVILLIVSSPVAGGSQWLSQPRLQCLTAAPSNNGADRAQHVSIQDVACLSGFWLRS